MVRGLKNFFLKKGEVLVGEMAGKGEEQDGKCERRIERNKKKRRVEFEKIEKLFLSVSSGYAKRQSGECGF